MTTPCHGQISATEPKVKALYLFSFPKYVDWPAPAFVETNSPLLLGVVGQDAVAEELKELIVGKVINGRRVVLCRPETCPDFKNCHVIFIGGSDKKRTMEILEKLAGTTALTVGESDSFLQCGGMVNFSRKENKVRIQINRTAAENAGLVISSRLLKVADVLSAPAGEKRD